MSVLDEQDRASVGLRKCCCLPDCWSGTVGRDEDGVQGKRDHCSSAIFMSTYRDELEPGWAWKGQHLLGNPNSFIVLLSG